MKLKGICAFALFFAITFAFALSVTPSWAQTTSDFKLGFKALADRIPDVVGTPTENEHFDILKGASEQRTTKGTMVWRKMDNWTAFTDGTTTWVNGPAGVQARLSAERFLWENTPVGAEAPRPAMPVGPKQAPLSAAAMIQGSGAAATGVQIAAAPAAAAAPAPVATTAPAAPAASPAAAAPAAKPAATSTDACLACHGPFDKLVTATANYVWPNGDKQTPHRYVDHDTKNVPDCTNCHKPHNVPPTPADITAMGKADPKWCYSCHHTGDLKCGTCH